METRFRDLADLARLPWFKVVDGRLVMHDRSVGPIIDMHTHLALAYVRPLQLDLRKPTPWTEHYLPACCAVDLDVYVNRNFTVARLKQMKRDLTLGSLTAGGLRATHTLPNLLREMGEMGIARSVLLPIDFPFLSRNSENALEVTRGVEGIVCFGSIHPYDVDMEHHLDDLVARGARGVKMHPAVQSVRPDNERAIKLYRACGARGLPVLWHCGPVGIEPRLGRHLSQVRFYERPLRECPETTFVLGHAGALQVEEATALLNRYPNAWMEISSQGLPALRRLLEQGDTRRIMYGTDWPFYHQAIALAKVLMATEGNAALRHGVLYGNAARLLRLPS
ncbi:MAG: amidohydrolase family protein [Deltaproteobacteria bacterium]|nr:amidohydrolase family protein [Deltaproteobacteria bacterium]